LGFERTIVEGVEFDRSTLVVRCRPALRDRSRCGLCGRRAPGYDQGSGLREWRALDAGSLQVVIRAVAAGAAITPVVSLQAAVVTAFGATTDGNRAGTRVGVCR
jgi:hypothetical protein